MSKTAEKIETVKVTRPIIGAKSAPRWIVRDINDSRVERLEERDIPKNVRKMMANSHSMFFQAVHTPRGWDISPITAEGW